MFPLRSQRWSPECKSELLRRERTSSVGKIILKLILRKFGERLWTRFMWPSGRSLANTVMRRPSIRTSIHPSIHPSINLWLYRPFVEPWPLFTFLILFTVGRTLWTRDQPVARPLPTHRTTQTQNKCTQTSMPLVGFERTIPVFERAKTVCGLDRAATMVGCNESSGSIKFIL
jgi:hypothetical protein